MIAYADDLVVFISGKCRVDLENRGTLAMD